MIPGAYLDEFLSNITIFINANFIFKLQVNDPVPIASNVTNVLRRLVHLKGHHKVKSLSGFGIYLTILKRNSDTEF